MLIKLSFQRICTLIILISLINNIKERTTVIDDPTRDRFAAELKNLSLPHVHNLLITFFGIFIAPDTDQILRKNISIFAPYLWSHSEERLKYRVGAMIDGYRTNLDEVRLKRGQEFLTLVDGKAFEALPARVVALQNLAVQLRDAHQGYDNFYNEPSVIREILSYCKKSTDIPTDLLSSLVPVVISCRLGRGLTYRDGVSPSGVPLYDQFLGLLDDDGIIHCLLAIFSREITSKLTNAICQKHLGSILAILRGVAIAERLKQGIDLMIADLPNASRLHADKHFREVTSPFITWN